MRRGRRGIGQRHGGQQCFRIGMHRRLKDLLHRSGLDDLAHIHHRHSVANMANDTQVMGDEQIGQMQLFLELAEQVEDLGLNGHVERRHRLVGDDQVGGHGQSPGNGNALPLAAAELVWVAIRMFRP